MSLYSNLWMKQDLCGILLSEMNLAYRKIQNRGKDFIQQAEGLAQKQLEMIWNNACPDKRNIISFSYKGYTIYAPWIREDLQEEPFAWRMYGDPKASVNPFDYYGKRAASRFIVGIVEKNQ